MEYAINNILAHKLNHFGRTLSQQCRNKYNNTNIAKQFSVVILDAFSTIIVVLHANNRK